MPRQQLVRLSATLDVAALGREYLRRARSVFSGSGRFIYKMPLNLRHHFASRLIQSGVDLNTVRELLGHADITMVLRYADLSRDRLAMAVEEVAG
jgi:site-specific recombinase XerD